MQGDARHPVCLTQPASDKEGRPVHGGPLWSLTHREKCLQTARLVGGRQKIVHVCVLTHEAEYPAEGTVKLPGKTQTKDSRLLQLIKLKRKRTAFQADQPIEPTASSRKSPPTAPKRKSTPPKHRISQRSNRADQSPRKQGFAAYSAATTWPQT